MDLGAKIDASLGHKEAAFLRCGPLTWQGDRLHEATISKWGKDHIEDIMNANPSLKTNPFFMVTGLTWTSWCQLKCWSQANRQVEPSLTAKVPSTPLSGEAKVATQKDLAWAGSMTYGPSKDQVGFVYARVLIKFGNDLGFVIFLEGIFFSPSKFDFRRASTKVISSFLY